MIYVREEIIEKLKNCSAVVEFTKKDGTDRTMYCSLSADLIPDKEIEEGAKRKVNDSVVSVWDLEKLAWRSFRLDSIKQIRYY